MLSIRTILHPTDFSERSKYAFRLACTLARATGARIVVLHVQTPPMAASIEGVVSGLPEENPISARIDLARFEYPGIEVEHRLVEGDPASAIVEAAKGINCDMIIMGTHGRTGLSRMLMGSVAEVVLRRAPCPVLTAKAPLADVPSVKLVGEPTVAHGTA